MKTKKEIELESKAKKISIKEGSAYSIMDGFGLRYITAYALELGAKNYQIALLSAIPNLVGSISLVKSLKSLQKYSSRRKIVLFGVLAQALMWLPLILLGTLYFIFNIRSDIIPYSLIIIYTLLISFGSFSGPAWNSWMKDLIQKGRGKYFAKRNRIVGAVALICMLIAGYILEFYETKGIFIGFAIIFFIAFLGRIISAYQFTKQYEPKIKYEKSYFFTFREFIKQMPKNNFGKFTIFLALINLATFIASPFFSVYMLKDLGYNQNYLLYTLIIISPTISTILTLKFWGKFADKKGNMRALKISGFLIALIPLPWLLTPYLSNNLLHLTAFIILIELFSGFSWAGFNLVTGNYLYEAVSRQRAAICAAYLAIFNSLGIVLGSTLGGQMLSSSVSIFGISMFLIIFILSSVSRLAVYLFMFPQIKDPLKVKEYYEQNSALER